VGPEVATAGNADEAFIGGRPISGGAYPPEGGAAAGAMGVLGMLNAPGTAAAKFDEEDARSA